MENILHQMRSSFASIQAVALASVVIGTASQGAKTGGNTRKTSSISQMPSNCQRQPHRNQALQSTLSHRTIQDRQSLDHRDPTPSQVLLDSVGSSLELAIDTCDHAFLLLEQDLSHHSLVLVIQQMAMK